MIRAFDLLVSATVLVLACPLILLCIVATIFAIGWPGVFVDSRDGIGGKIFRHFKIKTMLGKPSHGRAYLESQRIPRFGGLLRRFHLDELPELCHILLGQMSLVGPRAIRPEHAKLLHFEGRTSVRPGWAGLAQLYLARYQVLLSKEQARLEAIYLKKRSLTYNLKIINSTLVQVLFPKRRVLRSKRVSKQYRDRLTK